MAKTEASSRVPLDNRKLTLPKARLLQAKKRVPLSSIRMLLPKTPRVSLLSSSIRMLLPKTPRVSLLSSSIRMLLPKTPRVSLLSSSIRTLLPKAPKVSLLRAKATALSSITAPSTQMPTRTQAGQLHKMARRGNRLETARGLITRTPARTMEGQDPARVLLTMEEIAVARRMGISLLRPAPMADRMPTPLAALMPTRLANRVTARERRLGERTSRECTAAVKARNPRAKRA